MYVDVDTCNSLVMNNLAPQSAQYVIKACDSKTSHTSLLEGLHIILNFNARKALMWNMKWLD